MDKGVLLMCMCDCGRKELSNGICSPRPIKAENPVRATLGLLLDKLLKPDQALTQAQSYLYLSGISHSQWSCPSHNLLRILLGPGLGAKWRIFFFFPFLQW